MKILIENNRNKLTQGIFPIRGKLKNAYTTAPKEYFDNEEVSGILRICGYSKYSKTFDPAKFKLDKVIIAADADADGDHICCLVCGLFLRYLPFVIEQGRLYKANPPLYGIAEGNKHVFFANNIEYVEYVQDKFCKANKICNMKGKVYSKKDITQILYQNMYYVEEVNKVSSLYSIDPLFLEFILRNRNLSEKKFISTIRKNYKFVDVTKHNGVLIIKGLVNNLIQTIFYNQQFIDECVEIIKLIDRSEDYYMVNGTQLSLYQLMTLYNSFEPKNITRYKGLGKQLPLTIAI